MQFPNEPKVIVWYRQRENQVLSHLCDTSFHNHHPKKKSPGCGPGPQSRTVALCCIVGHSPGCGT